jgi:hypothetical protein
MTYKCEECNLKYKSRMGIYKHNKNYHPELLIKEKNLNNKCKYCKKELCNYVSKWRHEKTCQSKKNHIESNELVQKMQQEIDLLKKKLDENSKIINNNSNNTTNIINQNIIYVVPFGKEPNNALPIEYIEKSINENGINSIIDIVKKKHFNPSLPEYHNFCVTAKNDNYASIIDPETKKIKYVNKKDVFDKVYSNVVSNVNLIKEPTKEIKQTIEKINNIPVSKKILKSLHFGINQEAYHNRELIKKTWENAKFEEDENTMSQNNNSNRKNKLEQNILDLIDEIKNSNK